MKQLTALRKIKQKYVLDVKRELYRRCPDKKFYVFDDYQVQDNKVKQKIDKLRKNGYTTMSNSTLAQIKNIYAISIDGTIVISQLTKNKIIDNFIENGIYIHVYENNINCIIYWFKKMSNHPVIISVLFSITASIISHFIIDYLK